MSTTEITMRQQEANLKVERIQRLFHLTVTQALTVAVCRHIEDGLAQDDEAERRWIDEGGRPPR